MRMNPEFRRNLWLEISPQRLVGMPLALGAILLVPYVAKGKIFGEAVAQTALVLFGILAIFWGSKLAGESVVAEIRDRTWDGQRMSVIGPWTMTWGKLLGSTVFSWYGAILCLLVYLFAIFRETGTAPLKTVLVIVGSALMGQTVALFASLTSVRKSRRFSRSQAAAFSVLGMIAALVVMPFGFRTGETIDWFGKSFEIVDLALISLILFLGWALAGVHRLMRLELQMKNSPWVWLGFVLFLMIFTAGFSFSAKDGFSVAMVLRSLLTAYVVGVGLVYAAAFSEPKDPMRFRRLLRAWRNRAWRVVLQVSPSWAITLPLLFAVAVVMFFVPPWDAAREARDFRFSLVAFQFFILRDLAVLLYFNLSRKPKRADMLAVLWLSLLWGVVPVILSGLGYARLAAFFHPWLEGESLTCLIVSPFEMLLAAWLVRRRWKAFYGSPAASGLEKAKSEQFE